MRTDWFTRIAAVGTAFALTGSVVLANPAAMALSSSRTARPAAPAPPVPAPPVPAPQNQPVLPSSQISVSRNPLKYLAAAVSEMPIGSGARAASPNPLMQPAPAHPHTGAPQQPPPAPTPEQFIEMAQTAERQGDVPQARLQFGHALSTWPGHVELLRAAARMEDRLNQMPMAETLYQQAVAANPGHAGALNDLGLCLARQGKLEASVQVLEQAVQLQPGKPLYRNNAATVLVEMRDDQRALGHLAAVHGTAEANYNLGQLLVQRGRAEEATPYFQVAVEQNPQLQPARVALAKLKDPGPTRDSVTPAEPQITPTSSAAQAPAAGPQFYYPPAPGGPDFGAATYVPPGYYPPAGVAPQAPAPAYGQASPRYLPPVATRPQQPARR